MFEKAIKSKSHVQKRPKTPTKKDIIGTKKFKENVENPHIKNLKTQNPSTKTNYSMSKKIHNDMKSERKILHVDIESDTTGSKCKTKKCQDKASNRILSQDKKSNSLPRSNPPNQATSKLSLKSVDFATSSSVWDFRPSLPDSESFRQLIDNNDSIHSHHLGKRKTLSRTSASDSNQDLRKKSTLSFRLPSDENETSQKRESIKLPMEKIDTNRSSIQGPQFGKIKSQELLPTRSILRKSSISFRLPSIVSGTSVQPNVAQKFPARTSTSNVSVSSLTRRKSANISLQNVAQQFPAKTSTKTTRTSTPSTSNLSVSVSSLTLRKSASKSLQNFVQQFPARTSTKTTRTSTPSTSSLTLRKSTNKSLQNFAQQFPARRSTKTMRTSTPSTSSVSVSSFTLRKSAYKALENIKSQTSLRKRNRIIKSMSNAVLRRTASKIKHSKRSKKSKKKPIEEPTKLPVSEDVIPDSSAALPFDELNLNEPTKMKRMVQKIKAALRAFKIMRKHLNDAVTEGIRRLQDEQKAQLRSIMRRQYPYADDLPSSTAKRLKYLWDELTSGHSVESYLESESNIVEEYEESSSDSSKTESSSFTTSSETESSSLVDENIENIYAFEETLSQTELRPPSVTEPEIPPKSLFNDLQPYIGKYIPIGVKLPIFDDMGTFVNPMTGSPITSIQSSSTSSAPLAITTSDEHPNTLTGIADIDGIEELEEENKIKLDKSLFYEWDRQDDELCRLKSSESLDTEQEKSYGLFFSQYLPEEELTIENPPPRVPTFAEKLPHIIRRFLNSLVTVCVLKVEKRPPSETLHKSLCKRKLMEHMVTLLRERQDVQNYNNRLRSKVVETLWRRKRFSLLAEKSKIEFKANQPERYNHACQNLDKIIMAYHESQEHCTPRVEEAKILHDKWNKKSKEAIRSLERLIRTTVIRDQEQIHLLQYVDFQLQKMATVRQEVSEWRYKLINIQHTYCTLKEKLVKPSNLGNGLSSTEYELLKFTINRLRDQISDKEVRLERWRKLAHRQIGMRTHLTECNAINLRVVEEKQFVLKTQIQTVYSLRRKISFMKSENAKIRQKISDLKWKCGLLNNPALLADHDIDVKHTVELREKINNWKHQWTILERQINALEKK